MNKPLLYFCLLIGPWLIIAFVETFFGDSYLLPENGDATRLIWASLFTTFVVFVLTIRELFKELLPRKDKITNIIFLVISIVALVIYSFMLNFIYSL
jgi:hypothetical protein